MANSDEKWYFSKERLENSPSRQCGIENYRELSYRQQAANFIQDMGQKLKVSQLCINTAIVYMHRFYVFHSFTHFPWASIASASIFLAAKVEEQPRKLENVIKCANLCKNPHENSRLEINSERYQAQSQDLVFNENILLQTLGFDVAIDHPHTHVVRCCHLVRASKDLAQTSYFMASNSLHLTTMCLQYKPTVVACFCIHLVCKWSNWEIPLSNEKREWFSYVDPSVTADLLKQLTEEFLTIFERCPSRLKEKIMAIGGYSPFETEKKLAIMPDMKEESHRQRHDSSKPGSADDSHKQRPSSRPPYDGNASSGSGQPPSDREYIRDKREAERMARHAASSSSKPNASSGQVQGKQPMSHGHHRPLVDPKMKQHGRLLSSSSSTSSSSGYVPHRDLLREATRDIGLKDYRDVTETNSKMSSRELQQQQKRDSMLKANVSADGSFIDNKQQRSGDMPRHSSGSVNNNNSSNNRQSLDPNKILKHESSSSNRHHENEIKKHLNSAPPFLNKSLNVTSRKMESSPFTESKSVPKVNSSSSVVAGKSEPHSAATNSYVPLPVDDKLKAEVDNKEDAPAAQQPPVIAKKPSLFSPEKSPPPAVAHHRQKTPPLFASHVPPTISPFNSPEPPAEKRNRTVSSSSEPELRPVMKKIDQVEGFENLLRDPSIGIKVNHQVPDIITPIPDTKSEKLSAVQTKELSKELKPPDLIPPFANPVSSQQQPSSAPQPPIMNGIETNPTLISNLLKESHGVVSHLPAITSPGEKVDNKDNQKDKDHHHKERKKKNKEKHKHKDKTRSKEDKEKKKKHKDKDREKHKADKGKEKEKQPAAPTAQPIKITIPKDKIQPPDPAIIGDSLKIKIPKNRLKPDTIEAPPPATTAPLRIKISKDVINNYSGAGETKKRERDKSSPKDGPPAKLAKSSHNRSNDSKQNGRSSYNKVSQLGDGETSVHRLAESKYINKGAPT